MSTFIQLCFLGIAASLGFQRASFWWLLPLTVALGVVGWLTDRYWKIRFYDIYSAGDWVKFWTETLIGLFLFMFAAFVAGHILRHAGQYFDLVQRF